MNNMKEGIENTPTTKVVKDTNFAIQEEENLSKINNFKDNAFAGSLPKDYWDIYARTLINEIENLKYDDLKTRVKNIDEEDLKEILNYTSKSNILLSKENDVYEFVLQEEKVIYNAITEDQTEKPGPLTFSQKCLCAKKKLEYAKGKFKQLNKTKCVGEFEEFVLKLKLIEQHLDKIQEAKVLFDQNFKSEAKHPVTGKIILQKVAKYFDDSIMKKMTMISRFQIQVESDNMKCKRLQCHIEEHRKRQTSLDIIKFKQAEIQHKKSCEQLEFCKDQLAKCKFQSSLASQKAFSLKRELEKEHADIKKVQSIVNHKEHLVKVMFAEKSKNTQRMKELELDMRKIQVDPRRHDLPEVSEYAATKKENEILNEKIKKWKDKIKHSEQQKHLRLMELKSEAMRM